MIRNSKNDYENRNSPKDQAPQLTFNYEQTATCVYQENFTDVSN